MNGVETCFMLFNQSLIISSKRYIFSYTFLFHQDFERELKFTSSFLSVLKNFGFRDILFMRFLSNQIQRSKIYFDIDIVF